MKRQNEDKLDSIIHVNDFAKGLIELNSVAKKLNEEEKASSRYMMDTLNSVCRKLITINIDSDKTNSIGMIMVEQEDLIVDTLGELSDDIIKASLRINIEDAKCDDVYDTIAPHIKDITSLFTKDDSGAPKKKPTFHPATRVTNVFEAPSKDLPWGVGGSSKIELDEEPDDDFEDEEHSGRVNPFYFIEHVDEMSSGEQPDLSDKGADLGNINDLFFKPEDVVQEDEEEKDIEDEEDLQNPPLNTEIYDAYDEADREIAEELGYLEDEDREEDQEDDTLNKTIVVPGGNKFDVEITLEESTEEPFIDDEDFDLMEPEEELEEPIDDEEPEEPAKLVEHNQRPSQMPRTKPVPPVIPEGDEEYFTITNPLGDAPKVDNRVIIKASDIRAELEENEGQDEQ